MNLRCRQQVCDVRERIQSAEGSAQYLFAANLLVSALHTLDSELEEMGAMQGLRAEFNERREVLIFCTLLKFFCCSYCCRLSFCEPCYKFTCTGIGAADLLNRALNAYVYLVRVSIEPFAFAN